VKEFIHYKKFLIFFILIVISIHILHFRVSEAKGQEINRTNTEDLNQTLSTKSIPIVTNDSQMANNTNNSILKNPNSFNSLSVEIFPDRKAYTEFEDIEIQVIVNGTDSGLVKLVLEVRDYNNTLIHRASTATNDSSFRFLLHPGKNGKYNASVTAIQGPKTEVSSSYFNVVSIFDTIIARFLYLAITFFSALMILITVGIKNKLVEEVLRFVFLSGIVLSLMTTLLFSDFQFGASSPIGLIMFPPGTGGNWVFNIGNALQIPVYVVVFGLVGGYLRYIYKTSKLIDGIKIQKPTSSFVSNDEDRVNDIGNNKDETTDKIKKVYSETKKNSDSEDILTDEEKRRNVFYESA